MTTNEPRTATTATFRVVCPADEPGQYDVLDEADIVEVVSYRWHIPTGLGLVEFVDHRGETRIAALDEIAIGE